MNVHIPIMPRIRTGFFLHSSSNKDPVTQPYILLDFVFVSGSDRTKQTV